MGWAAGLLRRRLRMRLLRALVIGALADTVLRSRRSECMAVPRNSALCGRGSGHRPRMLGGGGCCRFLDGARGVVSRRRFWQRRAGRCHRHEDDLSCDGPGHVCSGVLAGGSACRRRTRTRRACRRVGPRDSGSSRARAGLAAPKFAAGSWGPAGRQELTLFT